MRRPRKQTSGPASSRIAGYRDPLIRMTTAELRTAIDDAAKDRDATLKRLADDEGVAAAL